MINNSLPNLSWEILDELPADKAIIQFPRKPVDYAKDYLVSVIPENGKAWIGNFHGIDNHYFSGVFPWPLSGYLCVVSRGAAYLVQGNDPEIYKELSVVPITYAVYVMEFKMVLLVTFTDIFAFQENGIRWKTNELAIDGIEITEIRDGKIYGKSNQINRYASFTVDLQTGNTKLGEF